MVSFYQMLRDVFVPVLCLGQCHCTPPYRCPPLYPDQPKVQKPVDQRVAGGTTLLVLTWCVCVCVCVCVFVCVWPVLHTLIYSSTERKTSRAALQLLRGFLQLFSLCFCSCFCSSQSVSV